jgi:glycosyltransferase involved in cell wall biosynthesis
VAAWAILTGEYPPQAGGVSDYTRLIARELTRAGDKVTVWAPRCSNDESPDDGVEVRRLPDHYGLKTLLLFEQQLSSQNALRILVQYVPHAFGWKALNVPFCFWLKTRLSGRVAVMFHEVAFPVRRGQSVRQNALGLVNRAMARLMAQAASKAFVSIPHWTIALRPLLPRSTEVVWLPVPSSIDVVRDEQQVARIRARYSGGVLVGHFGTYGALHFPLLQQTLRDVLTGTDADVLLIGSGSESARTGLAARFPQFDSRLHATGTLTPAALSHQLAACDLMLQPYVDGVSTRRTTMMAVLAHGRPSVTTAGELTEGLWADSGAVLLAPAADPPALARACVQLAANPQQRNTLGEQARHLYEQRFDVRHTIAQLRA